MDDFFPPEKGSEVNWQRPSIEEEIEELEMTAGAIGIQLEDLVEAFSRAEMRELTDADLRNLENCDYHDRSWTLAQVREYLAQTKDFDRIEKGFQNNVAMSAPIVLFRKNKNPYLIAGNSRLLACRVLQKKPVALALSI